VKSDKIGLMNCLEASSVLSQFLIFLSPCTVKQHVLLFTRLENPLEINFGTAYVLKIKKQNHSAALSLTGIRI